MQSFQLKQNAESDNYHTTIATCPEYCDAERLVSIILAETPGAVEAFNSREEMVEYAREAMVSGHICIGIGCRAVSDTGRCP